MDSRTILVTGANRGIGLAIATEFVKNTKNTVLLGCRDLGAGEEAAQTLGENALAVHLDLSDGKTLNDQWAEIEKRYPSIDVLINNAAILVDSDAIDITEEEFREVLQVNVTAPFRLSKFVLPSMIERNYGRIVNISSGWGAFSEGLTGPFSYCFSKASLNALTLTMSQGLPRNVKINAARPGWVRTAMGGDAAPRSPEEGAETAVWLANLPEDGPTGGFFFDKESAEW